MELLAKLTQCFSPSGREDKIRRLIAEQVEEYVTDVYTDPMGNLICRKKGNGKRLMLAAHMDEIGFMVTHIDDCGFLRFTNVGGISPANCVNRGVVFENGTAGVISYEKSVKDLTLDKMYIDIGADCRRAAEERVQIGDMAVCSGEYTPMGGCAAAKSMDDRAGCYALIRAIQTAQSCPNDLYAVFTVQEELGLRGAKTAAYNVEPDMGIAIDVSMVGDTPESAKHSLSLGKGPGIKIKDASFIIHPKAREFMLKGAREAQIPYQLEAAQRGGTDAGAIHLSGGGVPSGTISIPTRYIHSPREVVSLADVENTALLAAKLIEMGI